MPADEQPGQSQTIGVLNESSLHADLKAWYALPGDETEVEVGRFVIDIVRGDTLIEIQTSNFGTIRSKLQRLVKEHRVLVIYPIAQEKYLVYIDPATNEVVRRRKSPKKGHIIDVFEALVRIPTLMHEKNFSLQVVFTHEEEVRSANDQRRHRRQRAHVLDRRLVQVIEQVQFDSTNDLLKLLPQDLPSPFTNRMLAERMGISIHITRKMTYSLRKLGLIKKVGKERNAFLFELVSSGSAKPEKPGEPAMLPHQQPEHSTDLLRKGLSG